MPESKISGLAGMTLKKKTLLLAVFSAVAMVVFLLISNQRQMQNVSQRILAQVSQNIAPVIISTSRSDTKDGYVFESKWTYEYTSSLCKGASIPLMSEDLLCKKRPEFLAGYKNPCWKETTKEGKETVRCMPYFHLLGADKCGSTDLFDRILQHPEMEPAGCGLFKECYYWCWTRYGVWMKNNSVPTRKTFEAYLAHFKQASSSIHLREVDGYHSHITGEGTPMDLWDFRGWPRIPQNEHLAEPLIMTPHLMKHMYPDPKLLVILRSPADRLYSDYYFLGYGNSPERFHKDAIRAVAMIENCQKTRTTKQCIFDMDMYVNLPMRIHISCYSVFMKEWMRVFPRESFLVLRNEDYGHDIKNHMNMVFSFLNMSRLPDEDMDVISNAKRKHVTQSKKNKGPMMESTRVLLNKFFEPFNKELATLLQDDRFLWKDNN
ncbi:carbohydrate sulfotransferase 15-like isoform X1 [Haliotis cracherodii]|uniref:carbohydrate sulfotransferase 15-like isoform X1 n=2 Tax=Haliotis cracherodii TaxID=6455 RepID=UPI0039E78BDC